MTRQKQHIARLMLHQAARHEYRWWAALSGIELEIVVEALQGLLDAADKERKNARRTRRISERAKGRAQSRLLSASRE